MSTREAEYKKDWINEHGKADEVVIEASSGKLVAAIYYYAPTHHEADIKKIWNGIAKELLIEELKELEDND